jgi:hypothetical protein
MAIGLRESLSTHSWSRCHLCNAWEEDMELVRWKNRSMIVPMVSIDLVVSTRFADIAAC